MARPSLASKNELVSAILSPQVLLAVVGLAAFLLTVARPGNLPLFTGPNKEGMKDEILANTQQVLDDVVKMEPSKLAADGKSGRGSGFIAQASKRKTK